MEYLCYEISQTEPDDPCHGIRADGTIEEDVIDLGQQSFATEVFSGDQLQFGGSIYSVIDRRQVLVPEGGSAMLLMLVELEADKSDATLGEVVRGSFTNERQVPTGAPSLAEED